MENPKESRKEYLKNYQKGYQQKYLNVKFTCEDCNKEYAMYNKTHHYKSRKHIINQFKNNKIDETEFIKKIKI